MNNLSEKFKFLTFINGVIKLVMQNKKISNLLGKINAGHFFEVDLMFGTLNNFLI